MNEVVKYLPATYTKINGLETLGRDCTIIVFQGKEYELTGKDVSNLIDKVESKLRAYKFYFINEACTTVYTMPRHVVEEGKKLGYQLAFQELILNQSVNWSLITNAIY